MKTRVGNYRGARAGHAIVFVMIVTAATFLILGGLLKWSVGNSTANVRNNQYFKTVAAAEAATEKVISALASEFMEEDAGHVFSNLETYKSLVPDRDESPLWANYVFSDGNGNVNRTHVAHLPPDGFRVLDSQYRGLHGYATAFRVISNARQINSQFPITAALRQDVEVATIPLFQFAIFYNLDLEINPGPDMTVTGPVHCNKTIYLRPGNTLRFKSDVTAVGALEMTRHPKDPDYPGPTSGRVIFEAGHDAGVSSLNLPIGTNNTPLGVRQIVEIPPATESPTSALGKQRYYNKADLIITVRDSGTIAHSGLADAFRTRLGTNEVRYFLTNVTFFDQREGRTVKASQIDIARLRHWNSTNRTLFKAALNSNDVRLIYIADLRSQSGSTMPGIRLVNGRTILPKGLTVATPNPLYVWGHYNISTNGVNIPQPGNNTTQTFPASLVGDSVTVLSTAWSDVNATRDINSRAAQPTTVNAAFLAGIVQTAPGSYSGGVENFPRFLENWSGKQFTYNGSMVVMYDSHQAIRRWPGTGSIYNPPVRVWAFDQNFTQVTKLPPGTPIARVLIRGKWITMTPGTTTVAGTAN